MHAIKTSMIEIVLKKFLIRRDGVIGSVFDKHTFDLHKNGKHVFRRTIIAFLELNKKMQLDASKLKRNEGFLIF